MKKIALIFTAVLGAAVISWSAPAAQSQPKSAQSKSDNSVQGSFLEDVKQTAPLHYYLLKKEHDKVFELLPLAVDIDAIEPLTGATALTMAARDETSDAYDVVKAMILLYGADLEEPERTGFKALHYAVQAGNLPVVAFLIDHGADMNGSPPKDPNCVADCEPGKKTPLYLAHSEGYSRIAEFLTSRGALPLDAATQEEVDVQGKILEALEKFKYSYRWLPDRENPGEMYRRRLNDKFDEIAQALRSAGRMDIADKLHAHTEALVQAMLSMPLEEGMQFLDWRRKVLDAFANPVIERP